MKMEQNGGALQPERGEGIIAGRNAVAEALSAGRSIDSILVARGERSGSVTAIAAKAKQKNITVKETDPRKLDFLCQEMNREINTTGSKANDLEMTKIVVEMKASWRSCGSRFKTSSKRERLCRLN